MTSTSSPNLSALELNCRNYVAMIAWYRELLDARVGHRDAVQCWLHAPGGFRLVLLRTGFAARPRESAGIHGPAFEFGSAAALAETYRALKSRNLYPERAIKNGLVTTLLYRDPDGNPVALRYLLPEAERAHEVNPLGDEFDPAQIFEAA
jgi:catechol-2,3-dioxygenase